MSVTDKDGEINDFHGWIDGEDGDFTPLTTRMPRNRRTGMTPGRILINWCQQAGCPLDQFRIRDVRELEGGPRILRFSAKQDLVTFLQLKNGRLNYCGSMMEVHYRKQNVAKHVFDWQQEDQMANLLLDDDASTKITKEI